MTAVIHLYSNTATQNRKRSTLIAHKVPQEI